MTRVEFAVLANAAVLFGIGVLTAIGNRDYFETVYIREDGILEWLTVVALGTAAAATAWRLIRGYAAFTRRQRCLLALAAAVLLFGTGEEISWGQRLADLESPALFQEFNAQGETNIHNLRVGGMKINQLIFGKLLAVLFLLYLLVLTPLYHRSDRVRVQLDGWCIPIPQRYQWIGYFVVIVMVEGLVQVFSETPKRGELTEFAVSVVAALNVLFPLNRAVFDRPG